MVSPLGKSLSFPLRVGADGRIRWSEGEENIRESIAVILQTELNERISLPDFGAGQLTGPDGGSGVAVLKGCENPTEAMQFNAWFNTQIDDLGSQGLAFLAHRLELGGGV